MLYPKLIEVSAGFFINPNGYTIGVGGGYYLNQESFLDLNISHRGDEFNSVKTVRNGVTIAYNRVVYKTQFGVLFNAGIGFSAVQQSVGEFETSSEVKSILLGPNISPEIVYNIKGDWCAVLKANQAFLFNQNTSDGKLWLMNYGLMVRKRL